jgi:hypothetical protein
VAFALSFCEAALYCATQYVTCWVGATIERSSTAAYNNYLQLMPRYYAGGTTPAYWLRTPGTSYTLAGSVAFQGGEGEVNIGRVNQDTVIGVFGHYRPAMWVGSGIFGGGGGGNTCTLSYDANGGSGAPGAQTVAINAYATISTTIPSHPTLAFKGWASTSTATTPEYQPGGSIYMTGNKTLFAVWGTNGQDWPEGVIGRVLTPDLSGDTINWIEIARYGKYSLIFRTNFLNINTVSGHNGDYAWQYTPSYGATSNYNTSNVRNYINNWFRGTAAGAADNLAAGARLRNYTMANNATSILGTCSNQVSITDGFSKPSATYRNTGDDVAFALSFSESANFCSLKHFVRQFAPQSYPSGSIAVGNYDRISIPNVYIYAAWLRSPGDTAGTAGALNYRLDGRAFQNTLSPGAGSEHGLVYPALWVDSDVFAKSTYVLYYNANGGSGAPPPQIIATNTSWPVSSVIPLHSNPNLEFRGWSLDQFATVPSYLPGDPFNIGVSDKTLFAVWGPKTTLGRTVHGFVWPMATSQLVPDFLQWHEIVVELRPTFKTPASAALSIKATLVNGSGKGEFTFTDVPENDYVLYIKRQGYLVRCMNVSITSSSPATVELAPPGIDDGGVFNLWWGDANNEGLVDNEDFALVYSYAENHITALHPNYNPSCDFNADGLIDTNDLLLIIDNWGKDMMSYPGANGVNFGI